MLSEPLSVTLQVVRVLDADLELCHARPLAERLQGDFYLSQEAIEQAIHVLGLLNCRSESFWKRPSMNRI